MLLILKKALWIGNLGTVMRVMEIVRCNIQQLWLGVKQCYVIVKQQTRNKYNNRHNIINIIFYIILLHRHFFFFLSASSRLK